jgi:hypothetical protein
MMMTTNKARDMNTSAAKNEAIQDACVQSMRKEWQMPKVSMLLLTKGTEGGTETQVETDSQSGLYS